MVMNLMPFKNNEMQILARSMDPKFISKSCT